LGKVKGPIPTFPVGRPSIHGLNLFGNNKKTLNVSSTLRVFYFYNESSTIRVCAERSPSTGGI
jgi:hypothetical protein